MVCNRRERSVELVARTEVRKLGGGAADYFTYHLMMNPANRRSAEPEFRMLMKDLRSGSLPEAIAKLAGLLAAPGATYTTCEVPLRSVQLWAGATYSRTRFLRWLFRAEGIVVEPCRTDWELLSGMGSGAEKGVKAAGDLKYEGAVAACRVIAEDLWAARVHYGLDDLVCFLCLSQNQEALGCEKLAQPPRSVTVAGDLGILPPCAPGTAQGSRMRLSSKTCEKSRAASGAGCAAGSAAACPARPRAPLRRWAAGVLGAMRRPPIIQELPLGTLVELLPIRDQVRLCRTSRSVRGSCLCHVRRWGSQCWTTVRRSVMDALMGDGPASAALTSSGVSPGSVFRALGSAFDVLERVCHQPLPADVPLLALGVARYSLKLVLTRDEVGRLGAHFRAGGCLHMPGVEAVECLLVMGPTNIRLLT